MRILPRIVWTTALGAILAVRAGAQSCHAGESTPALKLETRNGAGVARVVGLEPFVAETGPFVRYRRLVSSGTVYQQWLANANCALPSAPRSFEGGGQGSHAGLSVQGQGALTATDDVQNGKRRYTVTASGSYSPTPSGGVGGWGYLQIDTRGFGALFPGNGDSVWLSLDRFADVAVMVDTHLGPASVAGGTVAPGEFAPPALRDVWSRQIDVADSGQQNLSDASTRYRTDGGAMPLTEGGTPGALPLSSPAAYPAGAGAVTLTPTSLRLDFGGEGCFGPNAEGFYARFSGSAQMTLSIRDDEESASSRAEYAAHELLEQAAFSISEKFAYRNSLDSNHDAKVSLVEYRAFFQIPCPGEYEVSITVHDYRVGSVVPEVRAITTRQYFEAGLQQFTRRLAPLGKDVSSAAVAAHFRRPCSDQTPGGGSVKLGSVSVEMSLGLGLAGSAGGRVVLEADTIAPEIYSPAALVAHLPYDAASQSVRANGALRQLKAAACVADIVELSPASYVVNFYSLDQVGIPDPSTGIRAVSGAAISSFRFENPEPANPASGKLKITETRGSRSRVSTYSRTIAEGNVVTWKLERGDGTDVLATEEMVVTTVSASVRTERVTLKRGTTIDFVTEREITTFAWGEEITRETPDPDRAALATVSTFNATVGLPGYRQFATRISHDGSWQKRSYDATGRITRIVRPFLNSAFPTAEVAEHRVTETTYGVILATTGDGDAIDEQLTTVTEKTAGQITGRSFVVAWSKPVMLGDESFTRRTDAVATSASATDWNAPSNLVTETLTYATGPHTGRARRVVRPDGTATLAAYSLDAAGALTTVTATGQLNVAGDAILDGTRVTTVTNPQGHVVSEASHDIAPGRADLALASWDATATDALGRPTSMLHHDGLVTTRDYACCGLLNERGRDGVLATYDYDALGRRTHETRGGVTVRTDYDAAGRVLATVRLGNALPDDDITLQSNKYDLAGRLYEQRDARNRLTTFAETTAATGITTRTTTHPDLGTTIETRARDGSLLSVSGTAAAPRNYTYTVANGLAITTETRLGEGGATTEWTRTTRDFAGRPALTITPLDDTATPATATASQHYNALGQLVRAVDADGIPILYAYIARGELSVTALDLDRDGVIDYDGTDRVTRTTRDVTTRTVGPDTFTVLRTATKVWGTDNADTPTGVALTEQTPGGLRSWQTVPGPQGIAAPHGLTTSTVVMIDAATETRTVVTTAPDQTVVTQTYVSDRLSSETVARDTLGQLRSASHHYDAHGRLLSSTGARNGTTTYMWFDDDQLESVLSPDPDPDRIGPGDEPQLTQFGYDEAGRRSTVTHPDDAVTTTTYYPTGQVKKISGARSYPVEYTYDPQGRVKTLTTWQDHAAQTGAAVTTWNYHPATGRLMKKKYAAPAAGQPQPTLGYTYTDAGRLKTRTGGRGLVTTYGYTDGGDLETLAYSDTTPGITFGYDRRGRLSAVADAAGSRTLHYDPSGPLADETYAAGSGALASLAVDRTFDAQGRLGSIAANSASSMLSQIDFGYDPASRLKTVAFGTSTATYTYEANSAFLAETAIDTGGLVRLTTTRVHDKLDRLRSISHTPHVGAAVSSAYDYNAANQRTRAQRENATAWSYGYDALGQLASARQALVANDTTFAGRDFGYTFDDIGNRRTATRTTASGARTSTYTPDLLNRYTQRTVPGVAEALGGAVAGSAVTLDSPATGATIHFTDRDGESFRGEVPVDNAAAAQYPELTVTAVKNNAGPLGQDAVATLTRRALVPKSPEVFVHDADGNLTADGQWSYTWDAENRLIAVETLPALVAPDGPLPADRKRKVEYLYDAQHRRIARKTYSWNASSGSWILDSEFRYLYDGWQVIAEFAYNSSTSTFNLNASYAWGLDLSGTLQGAGGVGGLVFARLHNGAASVTHAAAADSNGNVLAYYDAATGERTARFEYGPFGEPLVDDGAVAEQLSYRFSTKPRDPLTGTYYYGFRHYSPTTGRWPNRDPLGEKGGANLYGMVNNDAVNNWDKLGLYPGVPSHGSAIPPEESVAILRNMTTSGGGSMRARLSKIIPHQAFWETKGKLSTDANNRFVYTCKNGWVDMGHFFRNALLVQTLKKSTVQELATGLENFQDTYNSNSTYSVEDLMSNYLGREFGETLASDPTANIADKWERFLRDAGAVRWDEVSTPLLRQDQISYLETRPHPQARSWEQGLNWQRSRPLWKCLCDGDRPRHPNHRF